MNNPIVNVGIGAASDILNAADFGAIGFMAALGNELLSKLLQNRAESARKIALLEMAKCQRSKFDLPDADQFIAIVYRYGRAALEGAASINLKMLAQVMSGQALQGEIYATEFNEFADVLSSLKAKEIVFIGNMVKLDRDGLVLKRDGSNDFYDHDQSVSIKLNNLLVGTIHFPKRRDVSSCAAGLLRTGLIYPSNYTADGSTIYSPTTELERLAELVDFDNVLGEVDI